jgi:hypothetical protein
MTTMPTIPNAASLFRSGDDVARRFARERSRPGAQSTHRGGGAGLIWSGSGLVVTNAHCVPRGAALGGAGRWRDARGGRIPSAA